MKNRGRAAEALRGDRRIRIIGGRAGVGKSEFCSNYALKLRDLGMPATIVDLDVVNPYFTTREQRGMFEQKGIPVIGPSGAMTLNDVPSVPSEINRIFLAETGPVLIDLGGDVNGARAFGPYVKRLSPDDFDVFIIVNANRPYHGTVDEVLAFWTDYEKMTGLALTGIVNNTHLLRETGEEDLQRGEQMCRKLSEMTGVPYRYIVVPETDGQTPVIQTTADAVFPLRQYLRPEWLD